MLKSFVRQSAIYLISSLIARAINFLVLPIYARTLTTVDLGIYELIMVFSAISGVFITLEITQGVARYFHETQDTTIRSSYVSSAFWFTIIVFSIFTLICTVAAETISAWLLDNPVQADTFRLALYAFWANGLSYFTLNQLRWQLKAKQYATASITQTIVSQSLSLYLIFGCNLGVNGLFLGSTLGGLVGGLIAWGYSRNHYSFTMDWNKLKEMIHFSAPLAISGMAALMMTQVDRIIIKEILGVTEVGIYGVTARIASLASILLIGFQVSLTPLITSARDDVSTPVHVATIFRYFVATALPIILCLTIFSLEIVQIVAGGSYLRAHIIIPLLAMGTLLSGMYVFSPGLWLAKRTVITLSINVFVALLNAGMAILLVSHIGLMGAALAYVMGSATHFLLTYQIGQKYFRIPVEWGKIRVSIYICVVISCIGVFGEVLSSLNKLLLVIVGSVGVCCPLIKKSEIRRFATVFSTLRI